MALRALLDTPALLWALVEPDKLSPRATAIIEDARNMIAVSAASAWEVAIKFELGRLPEGRIIVEGYHEHLKTLRAKELPITSTHAIKAGTFVAQHRDPFDRMLAAQSLLEGLIMISKDPVFTAFNVPTIW